jgi:hypothetical protein
LYLYDIKIQTNIKQNLVEKQNVKKLQFLIFLIGPNLAQPFWVWPRASPLFTCNVNSGEEDAEEEEGGGAGGSRWFFSSLFFFLSLSVFLLFFVFSFSAFFCSSFCSPSFFFLAAAPLCIYR